MFDRFVFRSVVALAALAVAASTAGAVTVATVPVGNLGNTGQLSGAGAGGWGPDQICGAVDYAYHIGKYEVTAGQYCEFLNAVATTADPYALYSENMAGGCGCGIQQTSISGRYVYVVAAGSVNRPVNYITWGDAARFANWLHNGQPGAPQGPATTEDGAYDLNGAMSREALMAVGREADWRWALPTEDEWYKAAYHRNDGNTANYFVYPTSNDNEPSNDLVEPTDPGNNANFYQDGYTIDAPYWMTPAGAFERSESPYNTFDQGGNLYEWNETEVDADSTRGLRGGCWGGMSNGMAARSRSFENPAVEDVYFGFRVVSLAVPGDANDDGNVDQEDASILGSHWLAGGADWSKGDFNDDHLVDDRDAAILAAHWGYHAISESAVAEPGSLGLAACGAVACLIGWRRRR
jgi:formylglycine-generating enzyme